MSKPTYEQCIAEAVDNLRQAEEAWPNDRIPDSAVTNVVHIANTWLNLAREIREGASIQTEVPKPVRLEDLTSTMLRIPVNISDEMNQQLYKRHSTHKHNETCRHNWVMGESPQRCSQCKMRSNDWITLFGRQFSVVDVYCTAACPTPDSIERVDNNPGAKPHEHTWGLHTGQCTVPGCTARVEMKGAPVPSTNPDGNHDHLFSVRHDTCTVPGCGLTREQVDIQNGHKWDEDSGMCKHDRCVAHQADHFQRPCPGLPEIQRASE